MIYKPYSSGVVRSYSLEGFSRAVQNSIGRKPLLITDKVVWVKGVDMSKMTTRTILKFLPGVFRVDGTRSGTNGTHFVLRAINMKPVKQEVAAWLKNHPPETTPVIKTKKRSSGRNRAAASKLRLAKTFLSSGKYALASKWLKKVISQFPGTPEALEAKTLLNKL